MKPFIAGVFACFCAFVFLPGPSATIAQVPPQNATLGGATFEVTTADGHVGLKATDAEVQAVLRSLSKKAGVPFEIDPAVKGKVTVTFAPLPLDEAVGRVLETVGAKNTLVEYVRDGKASPAEERITRVVVLRGDLGDTALRREVLHLLWVVGRGRYDAAEYQRLMEIGPQFLPLLLDVLRETKDSAFFKGNLVDVLALVCDSGCIPALEAEVPWAESEYRRYRDRGDDWRGYVTRVTGAVNRILADEAIAESGVLEMDPGQQVAAWAALLDSSTNPVLRNMARHALRKLGALSRDTLMEKNVHSPSKEGRQ